MKLVKNNKLFVDLTKIMVVHIMNNKIGCFKQFVLKRVVIEYSNQPEDTVTIMKVC